MDASCVSLSISSLVAARARGKNGTWKKEAWLARSMLEGIDQARQETARKGQWKRLRDGWILGPSLLSSSAPVLIFLWARLSGYILIHFAVLFSLRARDIKRRWTKKESISLASGASFVSSRARGRRRNWEPVTAPKKETVDDRLPVP